jgi:hypothetical protein
MDDKRVLNKNGLLSKIIAGFDLNHCKNQKIFNNYPNVSFRTGAY